MMTLLTNAMRFATQVVAVALFSTAALAADPLPDPDDGRPAPDFTATDTAGNQHSLADYRGQVVVINFWATWCAPCVREMPSLQRAAEALAEAEVQVLGINVGESREAIEQFVERVPIDFPLLLDEDMALGPRWSLKGLPTTYIIDKSGRIAHTVVGDKDWDDPQILSQIKKLTSKP